MRNRLAGQLKMTGIVVAGLACFWSRPAAAQVKLEYKFPEGRKLTYKTTEKVKQTLTIQGMESEIEHSEEIITSSTVGKRRDDSKTPIDEKVESLRADFTFPGGISLTVDTKNPDAKVESSPARVPGRGHQAGWRNEIHGRARRQEQGDGDRRDRKARRKSRQAEPAGTDTIKSQVQPDKLKRDYAQELHHLPDVLARPGESWERTEILELGNGQTLTMKKKFEYAGTEKVGDKTLDKIKSKVTEIDYKQDPNAEAQLKIVKNNMKVESSEGTILFDREAGRVVSSNEKLQVKGDMLTYSINGTELPGAIDLTRETKRELQPAAK